MGYFRPLPADGGGGPAPLAVCLTTELILDPKTGFDSPGLELSEHIAKCYLNITDDVIGRAKGQIFTICHFWLRRAKQPRQIEAETRK